MSPTREVIAHWIPTPDARLSEADINSYLRVVAFEDAGRAPCNYRIDFFDGPVDGRGQPRPAGSQDIRFQDGCLADGAGVNGVTVEALLAVCQDRLRAWQRTPYACAENEIAIGYVELALGTLKARTRTRYQQGVPDMNTANGETPGEAAEVKDEYNQVVSSRIKVEGGQLILEGAKKPIGLDGLRQTWKAWQQVEGVVKHWKPRLDDVELAFFDRLPLTQAANNGFHEFVQAVGQAG